MPSTDLYLMSIDRQTDSWSFGPAIPVTDRDGYDNQPYFLPDGQAVLYTSMHDGQTDIYRFDLDTKEFECTGVQPSFTNKLIRQGGEERVAVVLAPGTD